MALQEDNFEESLLVQIENALKKKQTKPLVESMSKMLLSEKEASSGGAGNAKPKVVNKSGLLMDWLHLLDPELSQANHEVKQKLLFAKSKTQQPSLKQTKNAISDSLF